MTYFSKPKLFLVSAQENRNKRICAEPFHRLIMRYSTYLFLNQQIFKSARRAKKDKIRKLLARAYEHGEMKSVCENFSEAAERLKKGERVGKHFAKIAKILPIDALGNTTISLELETVAATFVDLQELRHQADYNTGAKFKKMDVERKIKDVQDIFSRLWISISETEREVFLVALLTWRKIEKKVH